MLAVATAGMLGRVEPFGTWYYVFAWYPTLVLMDCVIASRAGAPLEDRAERGAGDRSGRSRFFLLSHPAHAASLLGWSVVVWLFFELLNFRLRNWYYVFVLDDAVARWAGVAVCFATVLPAVFLSERMLDSLGVARRLASPPLRVTPRLRRWLRFVGAITLVLPLGWPRLFFPLVWVGPTLLLDPWVHSRDPSRSLLGDLERGRPGRIVRLLAGGALIGLLWELFNARARSKWIYTVPGFEELKLFEMPVAGFLGFPPFALECFVIWQSLVLCGIAVAHPSTAQSPSTVQPGLPRALGARSSSRPPAAFGGRDAQRLARGDRQAQKRARIRSPAPRPLAATAAALVFSVVVVAGMERLTISSYMPGLRDLPGVPATVLSRAGYDVFSLAEADPARVLGDAGAEVSRGATASGRRGAGVLNSTRADVANWTEADASGWIEKARLAALRGIGAPNAGRLMQVGIASVEELARADASDLAARLRSSSGAEVLDSRVRVWIEAAQTAAMR
jgi:predicted flap endonuclease-1-like 5' DNA nuclease